MTVPVLRFDDPDEFIAELAERPPNVDNLVRLTHLCQLDADKAYRAGRQFVVASYLRDLRAPDTRLATVPTWPPALVVVELFVVCGAYYAEIPSTEADERARTIMETIRANAAALNLAVAGGRYRLPAAA
ncbi:MAG TPA: hypothetical protein VK052_06560 [Zeimonas sp.]|nr:hypothetical protein [Zeimonas sp.]